MINRNEQIEKEILSYILDKNNKIIPQRVTSSVLKRRGYLSYLESIFDSTYTHQESIFCLVNNIFNRPSCKICGTTLTYNKNGSYPTYCSAKCSNSDEKVLEKNKNAVSNSLKKLYSEKGEEIKKRRKNTLSAKYGDISSSSPFAIREIQDKANNTIQNKYGINNAFKLKSCKDNSKKFIQNKSIKMYSDLKLDVKYINDKLLAVYNQCEKHPYYEIETYNFYNRVKRNRHNIICPLCNPINSYSSLELRIKEILDKLNIKYITNTKSIISPLELDIYIPEHKIAFEINGIYWHNEYNKDKNYHLNKTTMCDNKNIRLIHIWEDTFNYKYDIIESQIYYYLNKITNRIYARKTEIKEIPKSDYDLFMQNNHLQGSVPTKIRLGLYYNKELIAAMGLGGLRKTVGLNKRDKTYELYRYCNKINTTVIGGFSKLLKHFEKTYNPSEILTYANRDISKGDVYVKNGFTFIKYTYPSYYWCDGDKRFNRFNFRKDKISDETNKHLTEVEIMHNNGYYRCYDSGNIKYIKTY